MFERMIETRGQKGRIKYDEKGGIKSRQKGEIK